MRPAALPALAALALLFAAAPAIAQDVAVKAGYAELEAWDTAGARKVADELLARSPDDRAALELAAHVRYEQGDYAGSVELLDKIGSEDEFAHLARTTVKELKDHKSRESEHFVIYYREGKDAVLPPYALDALERQRTALATSLGYMPPGKVRVEVLDDIRSLSRVSTLTLEAIKTSGTIAICKFDKLMITSPKALVRGYDWLDTLSHEYTHLVVSQMSRNTVPIWIHEGLAKFLESSWRGAPGLALSPASASLLADALKKSKLIPFDRMHPSMALLPSQEDAALAFAEVFTAVEFLYGKGGNVLLGKIVDNLKAGDRYDVAVGKATGGSFAKFQSDWMAYLAKREFPRETISLSAEKLKFKEDAGKDEKAKKNKDSKLDEDVRFGDFLEIEDLEGRKLAHLGELLRQRNRTAAAIEEFSKAYARVGARSPALSNRYAQALIKSGDLPRAEEILLASLKPYPGYPRTFQNLAEIYVTTKRFADAERSFLEVVSVDPFDPLPHAGLLRIYSDRKDEARASREKLALQILMGRKSDVPTTGTVHVACRPLAKVILDGVDTGKTTPATLELAPGSHVVKLVNEERGFAREEPVEIGAGDEKSLDVNVDADAAATPSSAK
ncbi:MAG TPA: tetratricopeptide repeat protein [Myxococcales bacterium]